MGSKQLKVTTIAKLILYLIKVMVTINCYMIFKFNISLLAILLDTVNALYTYSEELERICIHHIIIYYIACCDIISMFLSLALILTTNLNNVHVVVLVIAQTFFF